MPKKFRSFGPGYTAFVESDICGHWVSGGLQGLCEWGVWDNFEVSEYFVGVADDVLVMATEGHVLETRPHLRAYFRWRSIKRRELTAY